MIEFMGGTFAAIKEVTGNEPIDTSMISAILQSQGTRTERGNRVESGSTLFNPKYMAEMMKGESSMDHFAESLRNSYG